LDFTSTNIHSNSSGLGLGVNAGAPFVPLTIQGPNAKGSGANFSAVFVGTAEALASNPFGLQVNVLGSATASLRQIRLQTGQENLTNEGILALQGGGGRVAIGNFAPATALDVTGTITATAFAGPLTGNASTATALAADPADCSGNNFALGINATGVAQCAQPAFANLSGKASAAQGQEVWALADLTDVSATTGSGSTVMLNQVPVLKSYTVAGLPAAGTADRIAIVTDAATAGSCASGGGSSRSLCRDTGSAWEPLGDGGSGGGGGGANTALSNLASVAVNADLIPGGDGTLDLGASSPSWKNLYAKGVAKIGPAVSSFSAASQALLNLSNDYAAALNAGSTTIAFLGLSEDNTTSNTFGLYGTAVATHATGSRTNVIGVSGNAYNTSAGTVSYLMGVSGEAYPRGSGDITAVSGTSGYVEVNTTGGTVTDAIQLWAFGAVKTAGTVTNNYGVKVEDQAMSGANNYAIYTGLGRVQLGDTETIDKDNIAITATDALNLKNATASTAGVPVQYSPALRWTGHAWNTGGTPADNAVDMRAFVRPTSSNPPSFVWALRKSINGGAFSDVMTVSDGSVVTATTFSGALSGNATTAAALAADPADCSANNVATAINASGTLTCTQFLATSGSAGVGPSKAGTASTAARSDHDHRSFATLTWYFPGTPSTGVSPMILAVPQSIANGTILGMQVTVSTTSASSSSFNLQRCTASCTGTSPTFSNIYSSDNALSANTSEADFGTTNLTATLNAKDQFKANLVTIGSGLANVTITLTYKYDTAN
jgi:hypothetical protein